jgi:type I restriction enzyme S subunit
MNLRTEPAQKRKYFKVDALCRRISSGGTPSRRVQEFYADSGIPWVKTGELRDWAVDTKQIKERITEEAIRRSSAKRLPPGTILMAMYGDGHTIGTLGWLREEASCNQACCVFEVDSTRCENLFLFYALMYHRNDIIRLAHGGAQRNLSGRIIKNYEIAIPALPDQRLIASILSAYDTLIENNTRRIAILEEMARALYQEWFVHFRFPGHEHVPLVDSPLGPVPDGWEVATLSSISSYINRGIAPKYDDDASCRVINQKCIRNQKLDMSQSRRQSKIVPIEKHVRFGDVLVNSTGVGTLGRVAQVYEHPENTTIDTHVTIVRPGPKANVDWFGSTLVGMESYFEKQGAGATGQTELSRTRIAETEVVFPGADIQARFSATLAPMRQLMIALARKNTNLRATRDLLLPKLISGEIDVSALSEEPIAEAAD